MNVIVVDDEVEGNLQNTCRLIKDFYSCNRGQVEFIKTSTKALEYLSVHSEEVDLAILDHYLSGSPMTGVKLGETISLNYPHIALVMMTANPSVSLCTEAMELGFNSFLTKGSDTSPKAKLFLSLERIETLSSVQAKKKMKQDLKIEKERANKNLRLLEANYKSHELMTTEIHLECIELLCKRMIYNKSEKDWDDLQIPTRNFSRVLPFIEETIKKVGLKDDKFSFQYFGQRSQQHYRENHIKTVLDCINGIAPKEIELWKQLYEVSMNSRSTANSLETFFKQGSTNLEKADILLQKYPQRWLLARNYYKNQHFQKLL